MYISSKDFSRGQRGHFAPPGNDFASLAELGLNDKLALSQQLQLKSCPLYIFENLDLPP